MQLFLYSIIGISYKVKRTAEMCRAPFLLLEQKDLTGKRVFMWHTCDIEIGRLIFVQNAQVSICRTISLNVLKKIQDLGVNSGLRIHMNKVKIEVKILCNPCKNFENEVKSRIFLDLSWKKNPGRWKCSYSRFIA